MALVITYARDHAIGAIRIQIVIDDEDITRCNIPNIGFQPREFMLLSAQLRLLAAIVEDMEVNNTEGGDSMNIEQLLEANEADLPEDDEDIEVEMEEEEEEYEDEEEEEDIEEEDEEEDEEDDDDEDEED